jgi:hypothetical protein
LTSAKVEHLNAFSIDTLYFGLILMMIDTSGAGSAATWKVRVFLLTAHTAAAAAAAVAAAAAAAAVALVGGPCWVDSCPQVDLDHWWHPDTGACHLVVSHQLLLHQLLD